jgi:hypothetical protein
MKLESAEVDRFDFSMAQIRHRSNFGRERQVTTSDIQEPRDISLMAERNKSIRDSKQMN